jgi:GNAT superfamily N-acetyltransferase
VADTGLVIRPALTADLRRIQEIETAAGELFRTVGMDAIADDPPPTVEQLNAYVAAGTAWVATEPAGRVAGYILVETHGCWAHIEQVTVHPEHGRRGIGAALIVQVDQWAVERGLERLSLTTFRDVPWNAPYYQRLGFRHLPGTERPAWLRGVVEREKRHGLALWPRTVMSRGVTAGPSA